MHATAALAAEYAETIDLADLTGVVGRATVQTGGGRTASSAYGVDGVLQPRAHYAMGDRRWVLDVRDALTLTLPDLESGIGCAGCEWPQWFDFASVGVSWHDRLVRVAFNEEASGGLYNSANLLQAPALPAPAPGATPPAATPAPVQLVPAATTITTGSTRTSATVGAEASRQVSTGLTLSYLVAGGLDADSQALLPLQRTARADALLDYAFSRRDRLATLGYVQDTVFSAEPCVTFLGATAPAPTAGARCAPHDQLAQLTEAYRHRIDRSTTLTLSAGVTGAHASDSPALSTFWCNASSYCLFPFADALVSSRLGFRGTALLTVDASVAPLVDLRTGSVIERAQLLASVGEQVTRRVTLRA